MAYGPWNQAEMDAARDVAFPVLLEHLGAYYKLDTHFTPSDASGHSQRVQVTYEGRDFRFIFTGRKFVNVLLPADAVHRGGGGAIDLVHHITGYNFVHAVKVCLDARTDAAGVS
ncbi:hypothetical protein [Paraburkholderia sp. EG304]|uniref:hypothetical protein n=1 Tax=Paraburkholderia sp. EG304 TaxID=3237015 RepID=UPI00397B6BF5